MIADGPYKWSDYHQEGQRPTVRQTEVMKDVMAERGVKRQWMHREK
jgi:hypothetical protein